jgi:hypothetical protein
VKFMILIHSNPTTRELWESFPEEEKAEGFAAYGALYEELVASGELVVSEALSDPSLTKTIHITDGSTITTDGPFAEAKELLAGFFLVDCETEARAIEIAGRIPEAPFGVVQVRAIMDLSAVEM